MAPAREEDGRMPPESILAPEVDKDRERSSWEVLSLLRFFLAFIVALTHLKASCPLGPLGWVEGLGSFEAILGFLLISGYSIGHSIQRKPQGFFRRRMLRIYPVYIAAIVLTYIVERNAMTGVFLWNFILNLFFLGQIFQRYSYVDAAWSLDLEVWLYALAPLFLRLRAHVLELLIALSFLCYTFYTCGRSVARWPHYAGTIGGINLPCLAFIWIAGFYLSTCVSGKSRALLLAGGLLAGHLILGIGIDFIHRALHHETPLFFTTDLPAYGGPVVLLLSIFLIFRGVIHQRFHLGLGARRVCRFLGDISYPLYLVHTPTFRLFAPGYRHASLLILAMLAMATVVYLGCDFYSQRRKLA